MVAEALPDHAWITDITSALTIPVLVQYIQLRHRLKGVVLQPGTPDRVLWKWCTSGQYSMSSAYRAMFCCQAAIMGAKELWKTKAGSSRTLLNIRETPMT
jgi:hypothetical protein